MAGYIQLALQSCHVDEWCYGFQHGIGLMGTAADKFVDNHDIIAPVMLFSSDELDEKRDQLTKQQTAEFQNMIPECVIAIRKLLGAPIAPQVRTGENYIEPFTHAVPKPGRNDLCACGSGNKYKKCCGGSC